LITETNTLKKKAFVQGDQNMELWSLWKKN